MSTFQWKDLSNGLRLREDEYSWQGSFLDDARFFLRRDKAQPSVITDLLTGTQTDEVSANLLAEFISLTGGVHESCLVFTSVSLKVDTHEVTVDIHDRVVNIARGAMHSLRIPVRDHFLRQVGAKWDTVIEL